MHLQDEAADLLASAGIELPGGGANLPQLLEY